MAKDVTGDELQKEFEEHFEPVIQEMIEWAKPHVEAGVAILIAVNIRGNTDTARMLATSASSLLHPDIAAATHVLTDTSGYLPMLVMAEKAKATFQSPLASMVGKLHEVKGGMN
jgi:hypothetical protein